MHEMSIAMNVIELASTKAHEEGAKRINQIDVEIGTLSGVMIDSLNFCFDVACKGTVAEGAHLNVITIEGMGECQTCHKTFEVDSLFTPCPDCENYRVNITRGRELRVKSLVID